MALELNGHDVNLPLHVHWKPFANHEPPLLHGGQPISFGETRREVSVMFSVPTPKFVSIMFRETIAPAIVIVVMVPVFISVSPMSVPVALIVIPAVVSFMFVFVCKGCVS